MIKSYCNVLLHGSKSYHAEVHINPIGVLAIDILESKQHLSTEFEQLTFERKHTCTQIKGIEAANQKKWQLELTHQDAEHVNHLVARANQEYEQLMCDLM